MTAGARPFTGPVDSTNSPHAALRSVGHDTVSLTGGLWARRQAVNRETSLLHGYRQLEEAGNLDDLRIAAGLLKADYRGPVYMDSDVYKWLEAVAFELGRRSSPELSSLANKVIEIIAAAQGEDGYLNSHYQVAEPGRRWIDFAHGHELYCAGHLFQAAVAHHRATGDERLLGVARRFADHIDATFGPGRRAATPGHPEIEMALVELYRETGERRYLDLAQVFVDRRGCGLLGPSRFGGASSYFQDRVPVREAAALEGHAVRAVYLAAGLADLYLETGERALFAALDRQWRDLVSRRLYVTGGVGSRHLAEAFGQAYELPSELAYCETCAAIGSIMWSWRMLLATGESRFADLIERTLYNAFLSGVSLDGERYFYVNPLASNGDEEHLHRGGSVRRAWHDVACCPPNVMRLLASLGHYFATLDAEGLQLHQYGSARIATELGPGRALVLRMESDFPWDGAVRLTIEQTDSRRWSLSLRRPGWCEAPSVRLNGSSIDPRTDANGYLALDRVWASGDLVELDLPLETRLVAPHPWIESTRGCLAIERGPLVYCLEQCDHPGASLLDLELDPAAPLEASLQPDMLEGVVAVKAGGFQLNTTAWRDRLYRPLSSLGEPSRRPVSLTAVPYYAWANRGPGAMRVWVPSADTG